MGKTKKYCVDCGARLDSHRINSAQRSPTEYRVQLFRCENCSEIKGKDVVISVLREEIPEKKFFEDIMLRIFTEKKK